MKFYNFIIDCIISWVRIISLYLFIYKLTTVSNGNETRVSAGPLNAPAIVVFFCSPYCIKHIELV